MDSGGLCLWRSGRHSHRAELLHLDSKQVCTYIITVSIGVDNYVDAITLTIVVII